MGGRFGKYGDMKRKARLRCSRALKKDVCRLRHKSRKPKKDKRIQLQSTGKLKVSVEFKPYDIAPLFHKIIAAAQKPPRFFSESGSPTTASDSWPLRSFPGSH